MGRGRVIERDGQGRPVLMVGSHVKIDRRKRTEEKLARYQAELEHMVRERTRALEQTTSLLEATLDAIPDVLGVQDNQHRIIRYNAAGYRFLNMDPRGSRRQALFRAHRPQPRMRTVRHVPVLSYQATSLVNALRGGPGCLAGRPRLPHPG
jgi:PAS domain-containing protein